MTTLKVNSSSHIDLVIFNGTDNDLIIVFKSGSIYKYSNVPTSVFQQFTDAGSMGSFANHNIYYDYDFQRLN